MTPGDQSWVKLHHIHYTLGLCSTRSKEGRRDLWKEINTVLLYLKLPPLPGLKENVFMEKSVFFFTGVKLPNLDLRWWSWAGSYSLCSLSWRREVTARYISQKLFAVVEAANGFYNSAKWWKWRREMKSKRERESNWCFCAHKLGAERIHPVSFRKERQKDNVIYYRNI